MEGISKDKIAEAKTKLRETLNIEKVRQILNDRNFTEEQYDEYVRNIEKFVFLILESYISENKEEL